MKNEKKNNDITIKALQAEHYEQWLPLAKAYKTFYQTTATPEEYNAAWDRLLHSEVVHGLGAFLEKKEQQEELVGITHYIYHPTTWDQNVCYLQDLYTLESIRGQGIASALIKAVAQEAIQYPASRYFWLTHETNHIARRLYDKVAKHQGFLRYDYTLTP